ncbi:MAG TPA: hypothetical protein P5534_13175 [Candidatus Paceibacterota bacterium]|nr:hypothetical protein [Candidatus Paceibacterota bacterium]
MLDALLGESARFAVELAQRLRERVYLSVIPKLAAEEANATQENKPHTMREKCTDEML